jgi:hypothetical protein
VTTVDANKPLTARATLSQWIAAISVVGGVAFAVWTSLNDSRNMARQALDLAEKAVAKTSETQAQLEGAMVTLSTKLGRIEGLLEAMRDERSRQSH